MNFKRLQQAIEDFKENMKKNPRYNIERLADEKGKVKVFLPRESYMDWYTGKPLKGSTERFFDDDYIVRIHKDRIIKIDNGNTIVHIKGEED
jgi:hypothetical protein